MRFVSGRVPASTSSASRIFFWPTESQLGTSKRLGPLTDKKRTPISKAPLGNLDGLELDNSGNYLVSDWKAGKVFRVTKDGIATELFNGMKGSADIGFIKSEQIIPRVNEAQITAYDMAKYPKN